jgi:hypothetical protein|tara:strand:- start:275 stop:748 length:474 start_codon:yes stop_codon:yes gene_type:complete
MLRVALVTIFMIFSVSAAEARGCYSQSELESEQGLRIHSELMVIGLTCQKIKGGKNLYSKYQAFTRKNQYLIQEYENTMIRYYREAGAASPNKSLHNLRTGLANEISQKAIRMNIGAFCHHYKSRIDQALSMNHDTIRRWARKQWPSQPPTKPLCRS